MGTVQLSGCVDSMSAMDAIAANEFVGVVLEGEPEPIGSAGEGNAIDAVLLYYGQNATQTENDMWEYYKSIVVEGAGSFLKAVALEWQRIRCLPKLSSKQSGRRRVCFTCNALCSVTREL